MLYFLFVLGEEFYLKTNDQKYIGGKDLNRPRLVDIKDADLFDTVTMKPVWDYFYVKNKEDRVWEVTGKRKEVIYSSLKNGNVSQKFRFYSDPGLYEKGVQVRNGQGCIEYIKSTDTFERRLCDRSNINQFYHIVSTENYLKELKSNKSSIIPPVDNVVSNLDTPGLLANPKAVLSNIINYPIDETKKSSLMKDVISEKIPDDLENEENIRYSLTSDNIYRTPRNNPNITINIAVFSPFRYNDNNDSFSNMLPNYTNKSLDDYDSIKKLLTDNTPPASIKIGYNFSNLPSNSFNDAFMVD